MNDSWVHSSQDGCHPRYHLLAGLTQSHLISSRLVNECGEAHEFTRGSADREKCEPSEIVYCQWTQLLAWRRGHELAVIKLNRVRFGDDCEVFSISRLLNERGGSVHPTQTHCVPHPEHAKVLSVHDADTR